MSLNDLIDALNKRSQLKITTLGDDESPCIVHEVMSTGCLPLDAILGGGLPTGRITEIYGDQSSGKSLIAAQVAAVAQQEGHIVLYIDTESAVSIDIVKQVGVDIDNIIYALPETIDGDEGVFQLIENTIIETKNHFPEKLLLVVWDTIAATSTQKEMENKYGKATMGQHALLISQGFRKLRPYISKNRVCFLTINQTRKKIGILFGDDTATFGGKALAFYSSVRVELKTGKKIKRGKKVIGVTNRATVIKNKVAVPFGEADLPVYFGKGIDDALASFEYMRENELFGEVKGSWYSLYQDGELLAKCQRKGWSKVFDEHYDVITNIILGEE